MNLSESLSVGSVVNYTPCTSTPAARPPRVSLSPDGALADEMSNVAVSPPKNNATAADTDAAKKQTAKQKRRAAGAQKVKLGPDFFQYLRKDTFDTDRFKKGHDEVYSKAEMDKFDVDYNKQLGFDFCQRRRTKNKDVNARASRSATEEQDLDSNIEAFGVNTTDRRQLSRYILEDILKCYEGERFLVLIRKTENEVYGMVCGSSNRGVGGDREDGCATSPQRCKGTQEEEASCD